MKWLTLICLWLFADHQIFSQKPTHVFSSDSLTFQNVKSKKGKSWSISQGSQIKAKVRGQKAKKGFIHALSPDSLRIVTKAGLVSVSILSIKHLSIHRGVSRQLLSGKLISQGALLAVPAGLGLGLAFRETLVNGPFKKRFYLGALGFGIPSAALIISGSILRKKKLNLRKWNLLSKTISEPTVL